MVRHWYRLRNDVRGWRWRAAMNGAGAIATGLVAVIVGAAKFALGAWIILLLIPLLIALMMAIRRHYETVEAALTAEWSTASTPARPPRVLVPIGRIDQASLSALAYARSISPDVTAINVTDDERGALAMKERWEREAPEVPLVILESPYRALLAPLLAYIDAVERMDPGPRTTVVLSELVPRHFWESLLHNQVALRLKLRLFFRRNTVVIDVPYHLDPTPASRSSSSRP